VKMPARMPYYGTAAFREMQIPMFIRKAFLEQSTYDQVAIAIAHELSHVVLDSIAHPLRREEKAVDLTAMLLGFRRLYKSGCHKEENLGNATRCRRLGYLTFEEVRLADRVLAQDHWRSKIKATPPLHAIIACALLLVVGASVLFGVKEFYHRWQLHQTFVAEQAK